MTTIDKLDIAIHVQYARRTEFMESIQKEYRLTEADSIPPQTLVVDMSQRMSEMDLLFGVVTSYAPWAYFYPPKTYFSQRRAPFASYRVVPSLGSLEKQQADAAKLQNIRCKTPEEEEEKTALEEFFGYVEKINDLLGYVVGHVGQFIKG